LSNQTGKTESKESGSNPWNQMVRHKHHPRTQSHPLFRVPFGVTATHGRCWKGFLFSGFSFDKLFFFHHQ